MNLFGDPQFQSLAGRGPGLVEDDALGAAPGEA